jgi:hypothetical protein
MADRAAGWRRIAAGEAFPAPGTPGLGTAAHGFRAGTGLHGFPPICSGG